VTNALGTRMSTSGAGFGRGGNPMRAHQEQQKMALKPKPDATLRDLVRAADTLGLELHVRLAPATDPLNAARVACGLPIQERK
jgi:hypothetical protein